MRWALSKGDAYNAAIAKFKEDGTEVPDDLNPPEMLDGFGGWYDDFFRLSTERQIGMAEGEIPASAIDRHSDGWHYEDVLLFEYCMRELDKVYLMRGESKADQPPAISARDAFRAATAGRRK